MKSADGRKGSKYWGCICFKRFALYLSSTWSWSEATSDPMAACREPPAVGVSHGCCCCSIPPLVALEIWLVVSTPCGLLTLVSSKFKLTVGKLHSEIAAEMLLSMAPRSKSSLRNHDGSTSQPNDGDTRKLELGYTEAGTGC